MAIFAFAFSLLKKNGGIFVFLFLKNRKPYSRFFLKTENGICGYFTKFFFFKTDNSVFGFW